MLTIKSVFRKVEAANELSHFIHAPLHSVRVEVDDHYYGSYRSFDSFLEMLDTEFAIEAATAIQKLQVTHGSSYNQFVGCFDYAGEPVRVVFRVN